MPKEILNPKRVEYDQKVAQIRAEYDKTKSHPPDAGALTAYARAFRALGVLPPKTIAMPDFELELDLD